MQAKKEIINKKDLVDLISKVTLGQAEGIKTEQEIRQDILKSGLINKVVDKVRQENALLDQVKLIPGSPSLLLRIIKGRALVGLDQVDEDLTKSLQVHVQFQQARYSTKPVISSLEPIFNESVQFELPLKDLGLLVDIEAPIKLVLIQRSSALVKSIVGICNIDWRKCLYDGRVSILAELQECGQSQLTIGILDLSLELLGFNYLMKKDEVEFNVL